MHRLSTGIEGCEVDVVANEGRWKKNSVRHRLWTLLLLRTARQTS
jgi:hypothetical protein